MQTITTDNQRVKNRFWYNEASQIVIRVRADIKIFAVIVLTTIVNLLILELSGYKAEISLFAYWGVIQTVLFVTIPIILLIYLGYLVFQREPRPLFRLLLKSKLIITHRHLLISGYVMLTTISIFMSSFSAMKGAIPLIIPFRYDDLLVELDRLLFFGHAPWEVVHALFYSAYAVKFLNVNYNIWLVLIWAVSLFFLFSAQSKLRTQYLVSWVLCWFLLGNLLALLLSSAGPVFLERLDPLNTTYSGLTSLLTQHNENLANSGWGTLWALQTQYDLWLAYSENKEMLGSGISAMPSMHNSFAVLMALSMYRVKRWLGVLFIVHAIFIYIGSIALGWHYALDGIVSAPLTVLIWWLAGKYTSYKL
ncbi:phosphatase PAP2 family protein [Vibrio owensii]|uniref:phosphatase PAP2 family protein n=1 Tax=Vibrio owensii TaxID=696485 RepID=UPI00068A16F6|nr:phosphatase PAP2 family protein [Vibrio owensii]